MEDEADPASVEMTYLILPSDGPVDGIIDNELLSVLGLKRTPWWQFWKR